MIGPLLIVLTGVAGPEPMSASALQMTSGDCSPAIANVRGNVTVNCIGVDPGALRRLNAELSSRNLQISQKIREADLWTARYKELERHLAAAGKSSALSRQAQSYLRAGELEKAAAILDQILAANEPEVSQVAANHYTRALILQLQSRPLDALRHLEIAYQYRPDVLEYGSRYASELLDENDFGRAEPVLTVVLARVRELALKNPGAYQLDVAYTLMSLGILYTHIQEPQKAETAYLEALRIVTGAANQNPREYLPYVARTLDNLGNLYRLMQQPTQATAQFVMALDIWRTLAKESAASYEPELADTLNNLALLNIEARAFKEAETALTQALRIRRTLAKESPETYLPDLADTLNGLGMLYVGTQRMDDATAAYEEALEIRRRLAAVNPAMFQPRVAETLNNLASLYSKLQRNSDAESTYKEAIKEFRRLAQLNPTAYEADLATGLNNLAAFHATGGNLPDAQIEVGEALAINRKRWAANPQLAGDDLARSSLIQAQVLIWNHRPSVDTCPLFREAESAAHDPQLKDVAAARTTTCGAR